MTISPGTYLRDCRESRGLTREMVALATETSPETCHRDRTALIASIEADLVPVSVSTGIALYPVLGFDPDLLDVLIEVHARRLVDKVPAGSVELVPLRSCGSAR